ncbi:MAG: amidohydrolase [Hyphomicrobiales bacterium]|nr:amidohydrolase [Hyphomicrobiales bacterium]
MSKYRTLLAPLAVVVVWSVPAAAQAPDVIFTNGKVVTLDARSTVASALAVTGGIISAVGDDAGVSKLAGPGSIRVDLGGRTVVPGLIDSHIHALRSGLTYSIETDWSAIASIEEGLAALAATARKAKPGQWIIVSGGWHENQLRERRGPTPAELARAVPDHPAYVQHIYDYVVLNPKGIAALSLTKDSKLPPSGKVELDAAGEPTGVILGNLPSLTPLFGRVAKTDAAVELAGTQAFFKALAATGITGIIDAAGGGMFPQHYQPLFRLWERGELPIRVAFYLNGQKPGQEVADVKQMFQLLPRNFGDDRLKVSGIGEIVVWGTHDGPAGTVTTFSPPADARAALLDIATWAAERGQRIQIHASTNSSASQILDVFEQVHARTPIDRLRWVIAHIEDASKETLARMHRLGVGWAMQDRLLFVGDVWPKVMGTEAARRAPPFADGIAAGVVIAGGTDGPRSAPYSPFITLQWMLTGKTITGTALRDPQQAPTREQALRTYTVGGAWMAFDDDKRGTLEPGKWADLAVLSDDYFSVPEDRIGRITSLLTVVGGEVVHASGQFAAQSFSRRAATR